MLDHIDVHDPLAVMHQHDEDEQDPTRDGRHADEIESRRVWRRDWSETCLTFVTAADAVAAGAATRCAPMPVDATFAQLAIDSEALPQIGFAAAISAHERMARTVLGPPARIRSERRVHRETRGQPPGPPEARSPS